MRPQGPRKENKTRRANRGEGGQGSGGRGGGLWKAPQVTSRVVEFNAKKKTTMKDIPRGQNKGHDTLLTN